MKNAAIFWFTGLSGSGKTTVAVKSKDLLVKKGFSVLLLDGDDVRNRLHKHLGFSQRDIKENNSLIVDLCKKYRGRYDIIIVPIISPFSISRENARFGLQPGFYEIYFSLSVECAARRDTKGLYKKAMNKEITNLIGFSKGAVYEPPQNPDLVIDTAQESIQESVERFYNYAVDAVNSRIQ